MLICEQGSTEGLLDLAAAEAASFEFGDAASDDGGPAAHAPAGDGGEFPVAGPLSLLDLFDDILRYSEVPHLFYSINRIATFKEHLIN